MDALERGYFDNFETAFDTISEEMKSIRNALERIAVALQPKQAVRQEPAQDEQLALPITALDISTRAETALISNRCKTIGDVTTLTTHKLRLTWSCGEKTIKEIQTALAKRGLKLAQ